MVAEVHAEAAEQAEQHGLEHGRLHGMFVRGSGWASVEGEWIPTPSTGDGGAGYLPILIARAKARFPDLRLSLFGTIAIVWLWLGVLCLLVYDARLTWLPRLGMELVICAGKAVMKGRLSQIKPSTPCL